MIMKPDKYIKLLLASIFFFTFTHPAFCQNAPDSLPSTASLQQCIQIALQNQPAVKQSLIDEEIGDRQIKSALSGWLPQITGDASLVHNLQLATNVLNNNGQTQYIRLGSKNTSNFTLEANQSVFNTDLLLASKAAKYTRTQTKQNTESIKINTITNVSKAFYDILTSEEQLKILRENIGREEKQLKDARAQYEEGLVDPTDYQRATITLNNSYAELKTTSEALKYKFAYLKQLMGYSTENPLELTFNNDMMEQEMLLDTTETLKYDNRVEYRQLQTQKQLQSLDINYYRYGFLPSISAYINRTWAYQNNNFNNLYNNVFPSSQAGLTLSIPIFTGTRRTKNLRIAQLEDRRLDLDIINTKNQINTQYQQAMASYKSNLNDWKVSKDNVELSTKVYNTIKLQYNEGIKTYLDLMTAEADLRTTQINYLNSLYSVLASKLDVQQALGTINTNQ